MPLAPLCFVVMPFGVKRSDGGGWVDFDLIYAEILEPAIRVAGLEPLRADQEIVGGLVHRPMYEGRRSLPTMPSLTLRRLTPTCSTSSACATRYGRTRRFW